jgi:hypothetical protein
VPCWYACVITVQCVCRSEHVHGSEGFRHEVRDLTCVYVCVLMILPTLSRTLCRCCSKPRCQSLYVGECLCRMLCCALVWCVYCILHTSRTANSPDEDKVRGWVLVLEASAFAAVVLALALCAILIR